MKTNVTSAKGAQAKAAVLGNAVTNNKKEETPMLLLPVAPVQEKPVVKEKQQQEKSANQEATFEVAKKSPVAMSIDVLMDKADRTYLLRQRYQEIRDKRKQLEAFTISHDKDNAAVDFSRRKRLTISTANPVSIGKLLTDWMDDLNKHLKKIEGEIRAELEARN